MDFNAQANHWDTGRRKQRAKQISALIREKLEFTGDEVLLDYGCGTGLISFNLSQGVGTVVGYDSSLQMLEVFNSKIDSNKILSKNSLESYNNHFDCVVSSMVFHHIMNLDETLDDIYRILKVDGKLLIVDLDLDDGSFHRDEFDFKGHNGFNRNQFKSLVESHGFACIELETALRDNKRSDDKELQYSLFYLYAKKVDRIWFSKLLLLNLIRKLFNLKNT